MFDDEEYFYFVRAERNDDFGRATLIANREFPILRKAKEILKNGNSGRKI